LERPTDSELNWLMAKACGYTVQASCLKEYDYSTGYYYRPDEWIDPDGEFYDDNPPDFCQDQNLLSEVRLVVEFDKKFVRHLSQLIHGSDYDCATLDNYSYEQAVCMLKASPRAHIITALRILDQWPENWSLDI
jgi:hypothetical protein